MPCHAVFLGRCGGGGENREIGRGDGTALCAPPHSPETLCDIGGIDVGISGGVPDPSIRAGASGQYFDATVNHAGHDGQPSWIMVETEKGESHF